MYICICNAIAERDVRECARRGCCSMGDLSGELGVGTASHCEAVGDYISRELLEEILESEEEHIDFLETQLELMQKVGLQNWLQTWSKEPLPRLKSVS